MDDDSDESDSYLSELDNERGPGRMAIDEAKAELHLAEAALAASKDTQAASVKLLEFLDQYGKTLQAKDVEVSKMNDFLNVYSKQRSAESSRYQQAITESVTLQKNVEKASQKLARAEKVFAKKKKAATRDIRKQQEKKAHEKQQKRLEKQRTLEQRRKFWTTSVGKVVIHLDGSSVFTPGSSRRGSVISFDEKHPYSTSPEKETANLILTYVVPYASWVPRYELRINTPASSAKLVYRAEFGNFTAETWKDANITFSTSQTTFSGLEEKIPQLDPWNIKLAKAGGFDTGDRIWASGLHSQKEISSNHLSNNNNPKSSGLFAPKPVLQRGERLDSSAAASMFRQLHGYSVSNRNAGFGPTAPAPGFAPTAPSYAPTGFGSNGRSLFGSSAALGQASQAATASLFGPAQTNPPPPSGSLFGAARQARPESDPEESDLEQGAILGGDDAATLNPELNALGYQDSQRQNYGLTTSYELSGKRTITPSSVKRRHVITELDLKSVTISHVLVPKLRCAAFLKARITNTTTTSLLRGTAGMTVDGTFLGSISLPNCEPDNFVDLSLGVDPSIQVTYAKPTVRRATSGFFAKDDSAIFTRTCWIKNTKKTTASITVFDQVPVSEDERLRVNILEPKGLEQENDVTKLDALFAKGEKCKGQIHLLKNGLLKWAIEIKPGKDVKLVLEYESRIPSGQKIIGLQ